MGKTENQPRATVRKIPIISLLLLLLASLPTQGRRLDVWPGKAYASIAKALATATDGDVVYIHSGGVYREHLAIRRSVRLQGVGLPVVDGGKRGNIIEVRANGVTIDGLLLRNSGRSSRVDYCGIHAQGAERLNVSHCVFRSCQFSIMVQNGNNCIVEGNNISSDITYNPIMGNAIHCWKSDHLRIVNNRIGHNRDGIYLEFVNRSHIAHNTIDGCARYGLHFMFSHFNVFDNNRFSHNQAGVAVMFGHNVTMLNNLFADNQGTSSYGLLIKELQYSKIHGNCFLNNTVGLLVDGGSDLNIHQNEIRDNGWGIRLISASTNDTIYRNNFMGNTFDMTTNVSYNRNRVDGNYWDKYEGYDLNKDGRGDVPFHPLSLFSVLAEQDETVLLFFRSFLMNLLDATEKLLPTITPDNYVDNTPAMKPFRI